MHTFWWLQFYVVVRGKITCVGKEGAGLACGLRNVQGWQIQKRLWYSCCMLLGLWHGPTHFITSSALLVTVQVCSMDMHVFCLTLLMYQLPGFTEEGLQELMSA